MKHGAFHDNSRTCTFHHMLSMETHVLTPMDVMPNRITTAMVPAYSAAERREQGMKRVGQAKFIHIMQLVSKLLPIWKRARLHFSSYLRDGMHMRLLSVRGCFEGGCCNKMRARLNCFKLDWMVVTPSRICSEGGSCMLDTH